MMRRVVQFLFPRRRECVRCPQCWLVEDCAAYFETGKTDYRSDECPNHPRIPLAHLPSQRYLF